MCAPLQGLTFAYCSQLAKFLRSTANGHLAFPKLFFIPVPSNFGPTTWKPLNKTTWSSTVRDILICASVIRPVNATHPEGGENLINFLLFCIRHRFKNYQQQQHSFVLLPENSS